MTDNKMSWQQLHAVLHDFNQSFSLILENGDVIHIDEIVRLVPKKRLTGFGRWQNKQVVIKLFFNKHKSLTHLERDVIGVMALKERNIPTPALYYRGHTKDKKISVLVFEKIDKAVSLHDIWWQKESIEKVKPYLDVMVLELAMQHVMGIIQQDIHLSNFLIQNNKVITLDGGQILVKDYILPKQQSIEHLALFFSQLGVGHDALFQSLLRTYAKSRGWLLKNSDYESLTHGIKLHNERRWLEYSKKIVRPSSAFNYFRGVFSRGMYERKYQSAELIDVLLQPEDAFSHPTKKMIKNGRSTTVIRIEIGYKKYIIKRYNMKGIWHRLRRMLRETRAKKSWILSQKLSLLGVGVAKPVAYIENHFLLFTGVSYFISEYVSDKNVLESLLEEVDEDRMDLMISRVVFLLTQLFKLHYTHGDLKITNILVDQFNQPRLIDFDGMVEHLSTRGLLLAWEKEIERFLRNFNDHPDLQKRFQEVL